MAFPSTSGTYAYTLQGGLQLVMSLAGQIKAQAQGLASAASSNPVAANQILQFCADLASANAEFTSIAAIPGMAAYAQAQIGSTTENITTDFSTMQSAVAATIAWIKANFPADANGNLLALKFAADGTQTYNTFTVAELVGFVTQLNALVATIN